MDPRAERKARREAVAELSRDRQARGRNSKKATLFRRLRRWIGGMFANNLAPLLLRLLTRSWRVERHGEPGKELFDSDRPWIAVLWHGGMLASMCMRGHAHRNIAVLVSPSADGGLAKRALERLRYRIVRGSLSRRGARAMREMHQDLTQGGQLVITPDGPRGPRYSMNTGPAWLARATGTPLVTVSLVVSRAWRLRSWDRMAIPKPFARVQVHYGDPLVVAPDTSDAELEAASAELRERLLAHEPADHERAE